MSAKRAFQEALSQLATCLVEKLREPEQYTRTRMHPYLQKYPELVGAIDRALWFLEGIGHIAPRSLWFPSTKESREKYASGVLYVYFRGLAENKVRPPETADLIGQAAADFYTHKQLVVTARKRISRKPNQALAKRVRALSGNNRPR